MKRRNRASEDAAFSAAWTLFCTLHDAPSQAHAEALVRWLGDGRQNVCALDDVLTLWALSGAALAQPLRDADRAKGERWQ